MLAAQQKKEPEAALQIATVEVAGRLLPASHLLVRDMTEMRDVVAQCAMDEVYSLMKNSSGVRVKPGAYSDPPEGGGWLAARRRASQFCIVQQRPGELEDNLLSARLQRKRAGVNIVITPGILNPISQELANRVKDALKQRIPPEALGQSGGLLNLPEKVRRRMALCGVILAGLTGIAGGVKVISGRIEAREKAEMVQQLSQESALKRKLESVCFFAERNVKSPEVERFLDEDNNGDCFSLIEKLVSSPKVQERRQGLHFLKVLSMLEVASESTFYMNVNTGLLSNDEDADARIVSSFAYMEPKIRALTSDADKGIQKEAHEALAALHDSLHKEEAARTENCLLELNNIRMSLQDAVQGKHFDENGLKPMMDDVGYYHYAALKSLCESKDPQVQRNAVVLCKLLGEAESVAYSGGARKHAGFDGTSITPDLKFFNSLLSTVTRKASSNEVRAEAQRVISEWAEQQ